VQVQPQVQELEQQRARGLARGPEQRAQQALQRSHRHIQALQWPVSSYRHASIARMRLSKPNQ
jgi:hypothetical protein